MKHSLRSLRCGLPAALLLAALPLVAGRAQDAAAPDATPTASPTPRPRPKPSPTPDLSVPVGTVNGSAIYRPLLKSEVASPVDRALVIYDYNRRMPKLSPAQVDAAVHDFLRARFNNSEARLDAKLKELNATRPDFRQFVAEEVKVHLMLANVSRGSVSEDAARRNQAAYLAALRQHATVNTPRN